jgi:hypothetical protein
MPLSRGDVFAGYTIVRLLGSGGMGEVYRALLREQLYEAGYENQLMAPAPTNYKRHHYYNRIFAASRRPFEIGEIEPPTTNAFATSNFLHLMTARLRHRTHRPPSPDLGQGRIIQESPLPRRADRHPALSRTQPRPGRARRLEQVPIRTHPRPVLHSRTSPGRLQELQQPTDPQRP